MSWERLALRFGQGQTRGLKHREAESKAMCSSKKGCLPSGGQTEQQWGQPPFSGRAGRSLCLRVSLLIERGVTLLTSTPAHLTFPTREKEQERE